MDDECILDEARFFDPETNEWGYAVICCDPDHQKRPEPCPTEREMFRFPRPPSASAGGSGEGRELAGSVGTARVSKGTTSPSLSCDQSDGEGA